MVSFLEIQSYLFHAVYFAQVGRSNVLLQYFCFSPMSQKRVFTTQLSYSSLVQMSKKHTRIPDSQKNKIQGFVEGYCSLHPFFLITELSESICSILHNNLAFEFIHENTISPRRVSKDLLNMNIVKQV